MPVRFKPYLLFLEITTCLAFRLFVYEHSTACNDNIYNVFVVESCRGGENLLSTIVKVKVACIPFSCKFS